MADTIPSPGPGNAHERIYGWKAITHELGISERQAKRYADPRRRFRLPVRVDHRGVYITRWNLQRWVEDFDLPWGVPRDPMGDVVQRREARRRQSVVGPAKARPGASYEK